MAENTYVILAAGPGTRVSGPLHKALLPLGGRAILDRVLALAPPDSRIVLVVGHRGQQLRDYLRLSNADPEIEVVEDPCDWRYPHGPGGSLLVARRYVDPESNLVVTTCDDLWTEDVSVWAGSDSWIGVAPAPPGTADARWCHVAVGPDNRVVAVVDKNNLVEAPTGTAWTTWTGLARISAADQPLFWRVLEARYDGTRELQVIPGWQALVPNLGTRQLSWFTVGDESSYAAALDAADDTHRYRPGQATYVLPERGRVVKWSESGGTQELYYRGCHLGEVAVARPVEATRNLVAVPHVPGVTAYEHLEEFDAEQHAYRFVDRLWTWARGTVWTPSHLLPGERESYVDAALRFYRDKTLERVDLLPTDLREHAAKALANVNFEALAAGVQPVAWHGDLTFANVIVRPDGELRGIDWRGNFGGLPHGDRRHDVGKVLSGCLVHWLRATRRGSTEPWPLGEAAALRVVQLESKEDGHAARVIAGLCLLSSAPLHPEPVQTTLVQRAALALVGGYPCE